MKYTEHDKIEDHSGDALHYGGGRQWDNLMQGARDDVHPGRAIGDTRAKVEVMARDMLMWPGVQEVHVKFWDADSIIVPERDSRAPSESDMEIGHLSRENDRLTQINDSLHRRLERMEKALARALRLADRGRG